MVKSDGGLQSMKQDVKRYELIVVICGEFDTLPCYDRLPKDFYSAQ
jgi:hypothetical protein